MKVHQVFIISTVYIVLLAFQCKPGWSERRRGDNACNKEHFESFYMKMALCRPNVSVVCISKPASSCFKNLTNFKATAYVTGQQGQCLLEANVTDERTLQFFVEAKRIRNPNQDGSRSIGEAGGAPRHQKGRCLLRYICHKKAISTISMDCGAVFVSESGELYNFTKQRKLWKAPPDHKGFVYFTAKIQVAKDLREVDIMSTRIFALEEDSEYDPLAVKKDKLDQSQTSNLQAPTDLQQPGRILNDFASKAIGK